MLFLGEGLLALCEAIQHIHGYSIRYAVSSISCGDHLSRLRLITLPSVWHIETASTAIAASPVSCVGAIGGTELEVVLRGAWAIKLPVCSPLDVPDRALFLPGVRLVWIGVDTCYNWLCALGRTSRRCLSWRVGSLYMSLAGWDGAPLYLIPSLQDLFGSELGFTTEQRAVCEHGLDVLRHLEAKVSTGHERSPEIHIPRTSCHCTQSSASQPQ